MNIRKIFYGEGLTTLGLNKDSYSEAEKAKIPEPLSGQETALLAEKIFNNTDNRVAQHMVDSNVILTLSGFKPSTDVFISIAHESEIESVMLEVEKLNSYLEQTHPDIRISTSGRPSRKGNLTSIKVNSLLGYERLSKKSRLPGMTPFDSSTGWEGWWEWYKKVCDDLEEAQEQGKIPKTIHVIGGMIHGYPDQAILDAADSEHTDKKMGDVPIPNTGLYNEAEPSFLVYPEHLGDPSIQEYVKQAGQILKDFYDSEWHKKIAPQLAFHKEARE